MLGAPYSASLPLSFREGNTSCGHSPLYLLISQGTFYCGLCCLADGINHELPGKLHYSKQLTTNGNPQQTGLLEAHVQLIEGLIPPSDGQSLKQYRLAREQLTKTKPAHDIFPFTSALWELMGYQPPLATPLVRKLAGIEEPTIAAGLSISIYEVHVRIVKAIRTTLRYVRI